MTKELIYTLAIYKTLEDIDISVIVRDALYKYNAEVYLKSVKDKYK